jgi:uncharacterized coiled-coil DUF342 family protein
MDQQTPILQKIDEAVALIKLLQQEKDEAIAQSQMLKQEKDEAIAQSQMLRQEKDEAIAQSQTFKQENAQLKGLMALTESKLDEILVMGSASTNQQPREAVAAVNPN